MKGIPKCVLCDRRGGEDNPLVEEKVAGKAICKECIMAYYAFLVGEGLL